MAFEAIKKRAPCDVRGGLGSPAGRYTRAVTAISSRAAKQLCCALLLALLLISGLSACRRDGSTPPGEPLIVSAASDLQPVFEELGRRFEAERGRRVIFNFGSTGQLAHQIAAGAGVDLFAAADSSAVEMLRQEDLLLPESIAVYGIGRLTLWRRPDSTLHLTRLEDLTAPAVLRVVIANPSHAPYGRAAREALISSGLHAAVEPKLVFADNVRQALQLAESGNVDAAIVALSLSIPSTGVWTLVPAELHRPLDQTLAVVRASRNQADAQAFADLVSSEEGQSYLARYGFEPPPATP
jgi:molybdate transport system substrate-binding protein